jgi:hypothetical protein
MRFFSVVITAALTLPACTQPTLDRTAASEEALADYGTQRNGMHACPLGQLMRGAHVGNNVFDCVGGPFAFGVRDEFVQGEVPRTSDVNPYNEHGSPYEAYNYKAYGMLACPFGYAMSGYNAGANKATCAPLGRGPTAVYDYTTQYNYDGSHSMHACGSGVMAGIELDYNYFLCVF